MLISCTHNHTKFSDGRSTPEEYIAAAIQMEYSSIGFSEHGVLPFETSWSMKPDNINIYIDHIKRLKTSYKEEIEIYCGMEVDFVESINDEIMLLNQLERLDYYIGSVHFIGLLQNGQYWNIDGKAELFEIGFAEVFNGNSKKLVESYYTIVAKMVQLLKPTIIGHIDKIKLHNIQDKYFSENETYYKNAVICCLNEIEKSNSIIEFNTRGLYRHANKQPYPSVWFLKEIKKRNIPITINSDSHSVDDLGKEFATAVNYLKEAGFQASYVLRNGKWVESELISK